MLALVIHTFQYIFSKMTLYRLVYLLEGSERAAIQRNVGLLCVSAEGRSGLAATHPSVGP